MRMAALSVEIVRRDVRPTDRKARLMELSALVLLDDNPDAVKLVATWPVIGRRAQVVLEDNEVKISPDDLEYWGAISGVDPEDIERALPLLFHNGFCSPDGSLDPQVQRYINAKVAAKLPKARQ